MQSEVGDWHKKVWNLIRDNIGLILPIFLLQYFCYHYLFTSLNFNDHTFPSAQYFSFPSYKTMQEGRWFGDIIVSLHGGSGVQFVQLFIAALVQTLNVLLFAKLLGLKSKFDQLFAGMLIAMHPAFLDYFSYNIDGITFAIGDTLALLGVLYLNKLEKLNVNIGIPILFFLLSLASYQPKITIISLLLLFLLFKKLNNAYSINKDYLKVFYNSILTSTLSLIGALLLYFCSIKLIGLENSGKNQLNGLNVILEECLNSYQVFYLALKGGTDIYIPFSLKNLTNAYPLMVVLVAMATIIFHHIKQGAGVYSLLLKITILILMPVALNGGKVINENTYDSGGRLYFAFAYLFCFFIFQLNVPLFRRISITRFIAFFFIYSFSITATQQTNYIAFKSNYEINFINRILSKIENQVQNLADGQKQIVIFGRIPLKESLTKFLGVNTNKPFHSNFQRVSVFENYRQAVLLNYFYGSSIFKNPTKPTLDLAKSELVNMKVWPSNESVRLVNDSVIVILLEPYHAEITHTIIE